MSGSGAPLRVWRESVHRWAWECRVCGHVTEWPQWTMAMAVRCALTHLRNKHRAVPLPDVLRDRRRELIREIVARPDVRRVLDRLAPDD